MGFFSNKNPGYKQISKLAPGQQGTMNDLNAASQDAFSTAGNYYKDLMSPDSQAFQDFAAPEQRRFSEQTIPDLAEQFAGMGAGGLSSSGFRNAAVSAGTDLNERLGSIRAQLRMQGAQGLANLGQQGLQQYHENVYEKPQGSFLTEAAPLIGKIGGAALGSYLAPGVGTAAGAAAGEVAGNWVSGKGQSDPYGGNTRMNANAYDTEFRQTGL